MKLLKFSDMDDGWFVGGFEPTAYYTKDFEVNYRVHPKGQKWSKHYHTHVTEINLLIRGRMTIQNQELITGDIFILEPLELTDPIFLEDCEIVCVKTPSKADKVITE
jgi:quercetin dioxygenase-like cupin family protein